MMRLVMMTLTTLVLMTIIIITILIVIIIKNFIVIISITVIIVVCSHHCYNHEPHPHPRVGLGARLGKTNIQLERLGKGKLWIRNRNKVGHANKVWACFHKRSPHPSKWNLASPRVWHLSNMLVGGVGQCDRS